MAVKCGEPASLEDNFDYFDKSSIEKVHLQFCKTYLGVNKKTSNIACRVHLPLVDSLKFLVMAQ